jgi:hypothetical protein
MKARGRRPAPRAGLRPLLAFWFVGHMHQFTVAVAVFYFSFRHRNVDEL